MGILNLISSNFNLSYWGLQTAAMLITAIALKGFTISNPLSALFLVISLGFVNSHIWDTALFFNIPNQLSIHSVTLLCSNAVLFWIMVKLLPGISIKGIIAPLLAPIIFTITSILISEYGNNIDWNYLYKTTYEAIQKVKEFIQSAKSDGT